MVVFLYDQLSIKPLEGGVKGRQPLLPHVGLMLKTRNHKDRVLDRYAPFVTEKEYVDL